MSWTCVNYAEQIELPMLFLKIVMLLLSMECTWLGNAAKIPATNRATYGYLSTIHAAAGRQSGACATKSAENETGRLFPPSRWYARVQLSQAPAPSAPTVAPFLGKTFV